MTVICNENTCAPIREASIIRGQVCIEVVNHKLDHMLEVIERYCRQDMMCIGRVGGGSWNIYAKLSKRSLIHNPLYENFQSRARPLWGQLCL